MVKKIQQLKIGSEMQCKTLAQLFLSCSMLLHCWFPDLVYFACTASASGGCLDLVFKY